MNADREIYLSEQVTAFKVKVFQIYKSRAVLGLKRQKAKLRTLLLHENSSLFTKTVVFIAGKKIQQPKFVLFVFPLKCDCKHKFLCIKLA